MKKHGKATIFSLVLTGAFFLFPNFSVLPKAHAQTLEKMSAYTTYYNQNDGGRCENIALSSSRINGITLQAYGDFSFNQTVGERTEKAGYKTAKVISKGEFVQGVGGGVCQVSTTLYNAAILAGLTVTEFHPHSLRVSYVPLSRDAMVSAFSDLKIHNPHSFAVRLSLKAENGALVCKIFGKALKDTYSVESELVKELEAGEPIEKEGEEGILRYAQNGAQSTAYLLRYRGGVLIERKKLREDTYAPVRAIVGKKIPFATKKMP
ncbi:MAG: VanW family protein [Clostridia bacterium]|nr:VanW family protein [Clostridia bacterium]